MPRGRRPQTGSAGAGYANRTDLASAATQQAIRVPTGLPYGEGGMLEQAQGTQPLPAQSAPSIAPQQGQSPNDPMAAAAAMDFQPTGLFDPSDNPTEPVTHGLPVGPGAGPEALAHPPTAPSPTLSAAAFFNSLPKGDPILDRYRDVINAQIANQLANK